MRVFILCSGRTGSVSFIKACSHITNFSSDHEGLSRSIDGRFNYPDGHIEADNRLSWFLGSLDKAYGNEAYYVKLYRDKEATSNSFNRRWNLKTSIIYSFSEGILMTPVKKLTEDNKKAVCDLYYDTIYDNIDMFLKDKDHKMEIQLEEIKSGFKDFWEWIGAEGDLDAALKEFDTKHNPSKKRSWWSR